VRTIGAVCRDFLQSCGSVETHAREMSGRHSEGFAESGSVGSSRGCTWREQRQKRRGDRGHEEEERSGIEEGLYQTHWTISGALGFGQFDKRDEELDWLRRLVRDLELGVGGRYWRRDQDN